jgi:hypothetical protein
MFIDNSSEVTIPSENSLPQKLRNITILAHAKPKIYI